MLHEPKIKLLNIFLVEFILGHWTSTPAGTQHDFISLYCHNNACFHVAAIVQHIRSGGNLVVFFGVV